MERTILNFSSEPLAEAVIQLLKGQPDIGYTTSRAGSKTVIQLSSEPLAVSVAELLRAQSDGGYTVSRGATLGRSRFTTQLLAVRVSRELVACLDSYARETNRNRSDAVRDLLASGLASHKPTRSEAPVETASKGPASGEADAAQPGPPPKPASDKLTEAPRPTRRRAAARLEPPPAVCTRCDAPAGEPHWEKCPQNPNSGLFALLTGNPKRP